MNAITLQIKEKECFFWPHHARFENRPKNDDFEGFLGTAAAAALEDSPFSLLSTGVMITVVLLSVFAVRGGVDDSEGDKSTIGMLVI